MNDSHKDFAAIARLDANIDKLIEQRDEARADLALAQHTMVKDNRRYEEELENLRRELALATDRIEDLQAELDSATEQREEP